ncbi:hypothetical protein GCM10022630_21000 [Thermobifida alba]
MKANSRYAAAITPSAAASAASAATTADAVPVRAVKDDTPRRYPGKSDSGARFPANRVDRGGA